jgi:molybdenum cofactor guanylyltransferase
LKRLANQDSRRKGAIILAGGDSKRLGRPKALLDFGGQTLIDMMIGRLKTTFNEITVVTDRPELYQRLPVRLTGDLIKNRHKSPLRGIHAGLSASDLPYQFVAACDMPFLNLDLIDYMAGFAAAYDAVVPRVGFYFQPLHSFYSQKCIKLIEEQIKAEHFKIIDFYARLNIRFIELEEISRFDPGQESFININTMKDYEQALDIISSENTKTDILEGGGE